MVVDYVEMVKERIGSEDRIQRTYYANFERAAGFLVFSGKKILFVEAKGFLKKTYNITLEVPYKKIREVTVIGPNKLKIVDFDGKSLTFSTERSALSVEEALRSLMPVPGATP